MSVGGIRLGLGLVVVGCGIAPGGLAAQGPGSTPLADRAPAFYAAVGSAHERVDARNAPALGRRISLAVHDGGLANVLREIGRQSGLTFVFSEETVPRGARASLEARHITVAAALTELLYDAGVDVELSTPTQATLVPRPGRAGPPAARPARGGSIVGLIVDSITGAWIPNANVEIDETGASVMSGPRGTYAIPNVAPGQYRVTAKRLGFTPRTRPVIVEDGQVARLDFALGRPSTHLDEVVTTALGEQRRVQLGNVIATIQADSIVPTAPITSLTDLLSARAPGVDVIENSGVAGGGEAIRIRGQSSLVLQGDPIVIVDGIRQDNAPGGNSISSVTRFTPSPSRLNDIDPDDIETISVLKGPSASTEYGTDAANGVIIVTTKHGHAGTPKWHASAEQTASQVPSGSFPDYYFSWGRLTDGSNATTDFFGQPIRCPLVNAGFGTYSSTSGTCTVDSVTRFNPLNNPRYSVFGSGYRQQYDLDVSGGSDVLRYFLGGGVSDEIGVVQLPPVFRQEAASFQFPASTDHPNFVDRRNVRANTSVRLAPQLDVTVNGAYMETDQQTPDVSLLYGGAAFGIVHPDSADSYGYGSPFVSPLTALGQLANQSTVRWTGGATANWTPASWLTTRGTVGIDHGSQRTQNEFLPQAALYAGYGPNQGQLEVANGTTDIATADFRVSATARPLPAVQAVTSVGVQYANTITQSVTGVARGLSQTNFTLDGAAAPTILQTRVQMVTLGSYGEEELSYAERLFLTGAVRVDAGSGFGSNYNSALYPKASVSWLTVKDGPTTLRLRAAFGESGVQPPAGAALQLYQPAAGYLGGAPVSVLQLTTPGNPGLKPERSSEVEGGADLGFLGSRVNLELTVYSKLTNDALVNQNLGTTFGDITYEENVGKVRNSGAEATLTATLVATRAVTWDGTLNASINHNTLVTLGPGILPQSASAAQRQVAGYPLYGYWGARTTYADANHDGVLGLNEVSLAQSASYMGSSVPTQEASVATHVALLGNRLKVGALFDYRGGFKMLNEAAYVGSYNTTNQRGNNDPTAPLWEQARSVAAIESGGAIIPSGFFEDASYVRFRELSVTYMLPLSWSRAMHIRDLSLTGAVRNLALWTHYTGPDPEVSNTQAGYALSNTQYQFSSNTYLVNNNVREDDGAVPLPRYWMLRLNLGF